MRSLKGWLVACLIFIVSFSFIGCSQEKVQIDPEKQLTEYTKPAVVRVVSYTSINYQLSATLSKYLGTKTEQTYYDGGMGSGSVISDNGYIVTNAHVVETAKLDDKEATKRLDDKFVNDLIDSLQANDQKQGTNLAPLWKDIVKEHVKLGELKRVNKVILPGGDSFIFDVKSFGAPIGEGKDVAVIKIDTNNLPVIQIDQNDSIQTSDKVVIAGYPGKADLDGLADKDSALVSTYTNGAIAAKKSTEKGPLLQLDANVNPGNSGGPVLSKEGKIIGIATATSKDGIGWAVPSSTILEYARQAGAVINQPGVVTQKWQEGLTLYWGNYYQKAMPKFEEVQRLYGKHYGVAEYISKSQKAIADGKDRKDWNDYLIWIIAGAAVLLLVILVLVFFLLRSRKKRAAENSNLPNNP
ncbi:MAG TPA: trypsin-like peptidase domain-containing protein [Bacillota bacterium]|nr:trypsin-like peptidase domain-containing protein [Bacillota bacterium]